jgi:hypothetical protein
LTTSTEKKGDDIKIHLFVRRELDEPVHVDAV